jgi:hypothetical protein
MPMSFAFASPTIPGPIRFYSTIRSIGIEWDITGDTNHNATCTVQYHRQDQSTWHDFIPLFRVDFRGWMGTDTADRRYDMLAGSVMFLDSGSTYTIQLKLRDSDGGGKDTIITIATRPVPSFPAGGRTLYVAAGSGSGDGSPANPYKGLAAAQAAAQAGDIIMIGAGNYGNFAFNKSGSATGYILWKAMVNGPVVLDYSRIVGHNIWLHGLTFTNSQSQTYALVGQSGSVANVVTRCSFNGFSYSITMQGGSDDWYIADNTIVGDKTDPRVTGDFDGEGIELQHTSGHTVCNNSISRVADGVSYMQRNCDIFNNDIFDVVDDGIEPDYGYANIRIWQNRITNPRNHGLSLQPMYCGPWYFIRNQIVGAGCYMLKYRVVDRLCMAHNTFVGWNTFNIYDQNQLGALSRNNLWIQAGGNGYIWEAMTCGDCTQPERWTPDWRTDINYDGFDWGSSNPVFKWGSPVARYATLSTFSAAVGIEAHGIRVSAADLFDSLGVFNAESLFTRHCLTLKPGCGAIDKGDILAGINTDFSGSKPDLGAYELNKPLPLYGPRPETNVNPVGFINSLPCRHPTIAFIVHHVNESIEVRYSTAVFGRLTFFLFDISGKQVPVEQMTQGSSTSVFLKAGSKGLFIIRAKYRDKERSDAVRIVEKTIFVF